MPPLQQRTRPEQTRTEQSRTEQNNEVKNLTDNIGTNSTYFLPFTHNNQSLNIVIATYIQVNVNTLPYNVTSLANIVAYIILCLFLADFLAMSRCCWSPSLRLWKLAQCWKYADCVVCPSKVRTIVVHHKTIRSSIQRTVGVKKRLLEHSLRTWRMWYLFCFVYVSKVWNSTNYILVIISIYLLHIY